MTQPQDPGTIFARTVAVDEQLDGDYSPAAMVEAARAALRGEAQWTPYLTAPAILAAAMTAELADHRAELDEFRAAMTAAGITVPARPVTDAT